MINQGAERSMDGAIRVVGGAGRTDGHMPQTRRAHLASPVRWVMPYIVVAI